MKPNGFVFARRWTSQTSIFIRWHISRSSLPADVHDRKVFSSSLPSRHYRPTHGTVFGTTARRGAGDVGGSPGSRPPTTFGCPSQVLRVAGSTRSGENARVEVAAALRPVSSSIGLTSSSVVPGTSST